MAMYSKYINDIDTKDDFKKHTLSFYGGYYPIAANNRRHTGVHVKSNKAIHPIANGKIIACRITENELNTDEIYTKLYEERSFQPILKRLIDDSTDPHIRKIFDQKTNQLYKNMHDFPYYILEADKITDKEFSLLKPFICNISNNFVLIEHKMPCIKKHNADIIFYSLYMHLRAYNKIKEMGKEKLEKLPPCYLDIKQTENKLGETNVQVVSDNNCVGIDDIIGYAGDISCQKGICHIEVFTTDERLFKLENLIDINKEEISEIYKSVLNWDAFKIYKEPNDLFGVNAVDGICNINEIIQKIDSLKNIPEVIPGSYFLSNGITDHVEVEDAMKNKDIYNEFSKMILFTESEWDATHLDKNTNREHRLYSKEETDKNTDYLRSLQVFDGKEILPKYHKFYYIHPWEFVDHLKKIYPEYFILKKNGKILLYNYGYLRDENGYYILRDGIRVDDIEFNKIDNSLKIGSAKQPEQKIEYEMDTAKYFKNFGNFQTDVEYQALQINICYFQERYSIWEMARNVKFYRIGYDETDIPIVVTQVGRDDSDQKLIIACPHGDERNAQRLIIVAQRYFIKHGVQSNLALYFIPSISPTMGFADARGIPNSFFENKNIAIIDNNEEIFKIKKRFKLIDFGEERITIPKLYKAMDAGMRSLIQDQMDPKNPKHGIDANRDYYFSLTSSRVFARFISSLAGINYNTGEISDKSKIKNIAVFMMHGYTKLGDVYGPYTVNDYDTLAEMSQEVVDRVDYILNTLFTRNNYNIIKKNGQTIENKYFYLDTRTAPKKYAGEWARILYGEKGERGLLSFDIELEQNYNEQVRVPIYIHNKVGDDTLPFFREPKNGKIIDGSKGFFELVKNYFNNSKK